MLPWLGPTFKTVTRVEVVIVVVVFVLPWSTVVDILLAVVALVAVDADAGVASFLVGTCSSILWKETGLEGCHLRTQTINLNQGKHTSLPTSILCFTLFFQAVIWILDRKCLKNPAFKWSDKSCDFIRSKYWTINVSKMVLFGEGYLVFRWSMYAIVP